MGWERMSGFKEGRIAGGEGGKGEGERVGGSQGFENAAASLSQASIEK